MNGSANTGKTKIRKVKLQIKKKQARLKEKITKRIKIA
jgi:hypothetical protein